MKRKMCFLLGAVLAFPTFCGTVLTETDFTKNGKIMKYDFRSKGFGTFHGFLPKNWRENCNAPRLSRAALHLSIPYSTEWKTWTKTFQFDSDPDPTISLFLSIRGRGELDVRSIRLEEAEGEKHTLLTTDFSSARNSVTVSGKGSFRGMLPDGWKEDYTHFVKTSVQTEVAKQGDRKFLRFHVRGGQPQFQAPLDKLETGKYYRLTVTGDNRTGEALGLSLIHI